MVSESPFPLVYGLWPASPRASFWFLPRGLEAVGHVFGLPEILLGRAPEDHAPGHAPDRDRDAQITGNAKDIALHPGGGDLRPQTHARRVRGQGLNLLVQRIVEHGLHAGAPAHTAGLV